MATSCFCEISDEPPLAQQLLERRLEMGAQMSSTSELNEKDASIVCVEVEKSSESSLNALENAQKHARGQSGPRQWLWNAVSFLTVLTMLLLTLQFIMARGGVADPDIWWHLHNAEYLFQHHQLPRYDMYSFTVSGHPWLNHEWVAEIPFYLAWRAAGLSGLNALMLGVIDLIFLGLLYLCYQESRNFKASIAACCFSTFLACVSYGPRTILFGYAYLVILLIVLQRFRRKGHAPLWVLPPLFCLWANTHGSWSLGIIVFTVVVAAGFVEGTWGSVESELWTPAQSRKLVLTWLGSVAALFVNPFGYRLVLYPLDLAFRQKLNVAHVAEWVSVNFHDTRGKVVMFLLLGLLLTALLRRIRWTLAELVLVFFSLYSGLTHVRFLFLLAIVAAPVMAKILDFVPPYRREADTPVVNAFVIALMIAGMVYWWPNTAQLERAVADQYPAEVMPYLHMHPPAGPMLNFYLWGGYLNWNDRNLKVFLDSRVDIFEYAGVLKDYLDALALDHPDSLLDKYNIQYVLFPHDEPLTYVLEHDPRWKVLYDGKISVLLERTSEVPAGSGGKAAGAH
jgi:hypothetical protein